MNLRQIKNYYNRRPVEFLIKDNYPIYEDKEFIPRFSLKNIREISDIPVNEPIKYNEEIAKKAIKYGMVFLINYKGEKDSHFAGHERVIYFMVLGRSSKGKPLIRGWHLNGWSVSKNRHINKIWRMFRADRILSMTFTGSFYRLPPSGYNSYDKGMRGGIIAKADFNEIRKNQQKLIDKNKIISREEISIGDERSKFSSLKLKNTNSQIDLSRPLENAYIKNNVDVSNARISFCKSLYGNKYIAILGAIGETGNFVKAIDENGKQIGVYKVLDSISGQILKSIKSVKGNKIYDLYLLIKKL